MHSCVLYAQETWSGYANTSSPVFTLDVCKRTVTVRDPEFFKPGNAVLLHQTASIVGSLVGKCEFSRIDTVIGRIVYLNTSPVHEYLPERGLQLIRVLEATSARVSDTLYVLPWNGNNGGVLAVVCSDTLFINGTIDVSACGGRGGVASTNTRDTSMTSDSSSLATTTGGLGEGPTQARGGRARNAGGAGGGLGGVGGNGGYQTSAFDSLDVGGDSTPRLPDSAIVGGLLIGTGGGGGQQNDFHGTAGGSGGGALIILAKVIVANTANSILSRGADAASSTHDGAGGGGSGGMVVVIADTLIGRLSIDVSGGNGGNVMSDLYHHGPGGGGGGGVIGIASSKLQTLPVSLVDAGGGGLSEVRLNANISSYGAQGGTDGVQLIVDRIPIGPFRSGRIRLYALDSIVDFGMSTLVVATGGIAYSWIDADIIVKSRIGDTVQTPSIAEPRWFFVEITTAGGCIVRDSVLVRPRVLAMPAILISIDDAKAAPGDTVDLYVRVTCQPLNATDIVGTVYMSMRATTLLPIRFGIRLNDTTTQMTFPFRISARAGRTYRRGIARAVLGDSASVIMHIDSAKFETAVGRLQFDHGRFTLDAVCEFNGRPRLIKPTSAKYEISGRNISACADDLALTDLVGKTIDLNCVKTGDRISGQIPDVATGIFYLTITNGNNRHTVGIIVD